MRKIILILLILASFGVIHSSEKKIGVFGGYPNSSLTFAVNNIEAHLGFYYDLEKPAVESLYVSADYSFFKDYFSIGSVSGFFWGFGLGPYVSLDSNSDSEVGILAPIEFGWNIPKIFTNRLDLYLQLAAGTSVVPRPEMVWGLGIGLRLKL